MTTDVLVNIAQKAFDSLQRKERTIIVTVDLKAAFDRVWKNGLLRDLARLKIHPTALRWLRAFLADRKEAVRWDNTISRFRTFKEGVPQESPLSPLLFCLATATLPIRICSSAPGVYADKFADDFTISASGRTVAEAAVRLAPALREVKKWSADYEVLLSTEKTAALVVSFDPWETVGKASTGLSFLGTPIQNNRHQNSWSTPGHTDVIQKDCVGDGEKDQQKDTNPPSTSRQRLWHPCDRLVPTLQGLREARWSVRSGNLETISIEDSAPDA